jgi:hypothetical protein
VTEAEERKKERKKKSEAKVCGGEIGKKEKGW